MSAARDKREASEPGAELVARTRRQFLRGMAASFSVSAGCNALMLVVPIYCMELYNTVLNTRNERTLAWLTIGLAVALGIYGVLEFLRLLLQDALADRAARALSVPSLLAAARAGEERGAGSKAPALAGQAVHDLAELRGFLSSPAMIAPLDLIWSPVILVSFFLMHWAYGTYAVLCALVLTALGLAGDRLTRGPITEANEETVRAFAEVSSASRDAEAIEAMGMAPALLRRWRRAEARMLAKLWRGTRTLKGMTATTKALRLMMTGGMVGLGLVLTMQGASSGGGMVAANMLLAKLLLPFEQIVGSWRAWVGAGAAWRRVSSLLTETRGRRGAIALPCREGRLAVERLVYIPPASDRPVLRGVSFELLPGQVLGVVGPSGAGKSTLARLVMGIAEPTSGGAYLDGNSTWLWERADFGRHVGYMPQQPTLIAGTVAENIARMTDADPGEIIAAARIAGVHEAIMGLPHGYATQVSESGFVLSGGQRQRVALARALFGNPKLLVLDEPNSNLDAAGEQILLAAVETVRRRGTSVLLVAHRPSLVSIADRLLVLKDGMVDRFGARDAVLKVLSAPPIRLVRAAEAEDRPDEGSARRLGTDGRRAGP